ncbi:MAG: hypothetical protein M3R65_03540 [Gemmatimonadota bacterium]|nr:hypothetical protein [Gemmatimonadota bacterium]
MRIGQRLYLAVTPGIVGLFAVAALAYWGQYAHRAPEIVVVVAAMATIASLATAWVNTRYVARRVERMAATTVLSGAVVRTRDEAIQKERTANARAEEYQSLLADVTDLMGARLQEAELPLHVLLSSPFGTLNENQEELVSDAQSAIGVADDEVRHLKQLIELDRGLVPVHLQPVNLAELLRPALAIASAHARRTRVDLQSDVSDSSARVLVDPVHVQEALTAVLDWVISNAAAGAPLIVRAADSDAGLITISICHPAISADAIPPVTMLIATRLLEMQHGTITRARGSLTLQLPSEEMTSLRRTNAAAATHPL